MAKVLNKKRATPAEQRAAIYVGRPTKWGNPYSHVDGTLASHKVASRDEAVEQYEKNLSNELRQAARKELRGKDLLCWCAPERCHADVLLRIANE